MKDRRQSSSSVRRPVSRPSAMLSTSGPSSGFSELRQRLWLQQHGATASIRTLDELRASIDQARSRIDQQLVQVERARAAAP